MSDTTTPRERFKTAAEAVVRKHSRNVGDRGINGPDSALHVGPAGRDDPGLLELLADAAEAAYGVAPAPGGKRQRAV
jgi:hypothetical protein